MKRIQSQKDLIVKLKQDIKTCKKDKVVFLCGHFPLVYPKDSNIAVEALNYWGEFSIFTLELACKIGEFAKLLAKQVEFIFFVDDHSYEVINNLSPRKLSTMRNRLYQLRSGKKAELPEEFSKIMQKYEWSIKNILRYDHGKTGRHDCLYFSEKILRTSKKSISNACAREYTEFVNDNKYFNKAKTYLIAFIPQRCKGHICEVALAQEVKDLNASHVFIETMNPAADRNELFAIGQGVLYRKD